MDTKGTIDCFFTEKGYGFLSDESGIRRFFHIKDTTPGFRPESGCPVLFEARTGKKGPAAAQVREDPEAVRPAHPNGRCFCPHCGTSIIPRLVLNIGTPVYSVCSFCGGIVADFRKPSDNSRTRIFTVSRAIRAVLVAMVVLGITVSPTPQFLGLCVFIIIALLVVKWSRA